MLRSESRTGTVGPTDTGGWWELDLIWDGTEGGKGLVESYIPRLGGPLLLKGDLDYPGLFFLNVYSNVESPK